MVSHAWGKRVGRSNEGAGRLLELWTCKVVKPDPGQKKPRELKCRDEEETERQAGAGRVSVLGSGNCRVRVKKRK